MACGMPVVSTDGGALPEVVGDAGVTVPVKDPEAIARAITDLLEHPEKRQTLSIRARERIEQRFSWQVAADAMTNCYRQVLATHTTCR